MTKWKKSYQPPVPYQLYARASQPKLGPDRKFYEDRVERLPWLDAGQI